MVTPYTSARALTGIPPTLAGVGAVEPAPEADRNAATESTPLNAEIMIPPATESENVAPTTRIESKHPPSLQSTSWYNGGKFWTSKATYVAIEMLPARTESTSR